MGAVSKDEFTTWLLMACFRDHDKLRIDMKNGDIAEGTIVAFNAKDNILGRGESIAIWNKTKGYLDILFSEDMVTIQILR